MPPNFLVFCADQMQSQCLGCNGLGYRYKIKAAKD